MTIVQASNGFPGGEGATRLAQQKVTVVGQRLRVWDEEHGWALYVSVPDRLVQEFPEPRRYMERPFAYYAKYRDDRARALREQAAQFIQMRDRYNADMPDKALALRDLVQTYTHAGGDPRNPGQIRARVERFPNDRKTVKVLVDREERTVTVDHVQVRENNAQRPVFDMWITTDILLPVDMFVFWQQLGTFAPEVSALLPSAIEVPGPDGRPVRGTVIECRAVLDAGTLQREFRSQVLEVRKDEGTIADVTPPKEEAELVQPQAAEGAGADKVRCAMTGVELDREAALVVQHPNGRTYYVASPEQRTALFKCIRDGREPPHASAVAPGGGR